MSNPSIRYGANFKIVGKCDPQKLSYAGAWENCEGNLTTLAEHIGKGFPWMPAVLDGNRKRWQRNANYATVLGLDIDDGLTISAALQHPYISQYCGLGIESSSSTPEHHKFRLVFRLPSPVQDWQLIRICNRYLAEMVGSADPACKDASRFFFGSPGRSPFILDESKTLPESFVEDAKAWHEHQEELQRKADEEWRKQWQQYRDDNPEQDQDKLIEQALDYADPDSSYQDWITVGMTLNALYGDSGLGLWDRWSATGSTYKAKEIGSKWRSFKRCEPRLGHLFNLAKRGGFTFPGRVSGDRLQSVKPTKRVTPNSGKKIPPPRRDGSGLLNKIGATFRSLISSQKSKPLPVRGFSPVADSVDIEYEQGDRLRTLQHLENQGFKYILDQSQTGSGKSFDSGNINPDNFGARQAIYASAEHRNPTNDTLTSDNGWVDLEARHDGLTRDDKGRLRRKKRGEQYVVAPNCNRTRLIGALRAKNVTGADSSKLVCGGCPLKEACQHSQGNGYGFLSQRRDGLSSAKLRSHPDSLPIPTEYAYNESLILWDETGEIFKNRDTVEVYQHDLEAAITRLLQADQLVPVQQLLSALLTLFGAKKKRYGMNHQSILNELPSVDEVDVEAIALALHPDLSLLNPTSEYGADLADLPKSVRRQFAERDATKADEVEQRVIKQWLPQLLRVLQGQIPGAMLHLDNLKLTISLPDNRHRAIAQAAKCNIFMDATLSHEDLALMLGCDPSEIAVVKQRTVNHNNVDRIQIFDLGRMGMKRGADQERRLEALISHFKTVDQGAKVIDFKKFDADGAWWVDSRGVNDFQDCKTLILVGTPCRNLNDLMAEYAALAGYVPTSDDEGLKAFCDRRIAADMIQADGRVRANRRPDDYIQTIWITDFNLPFDAEQVKASDVTIEAGSKVERLVAAAKRAYDQLTEQGAKITQTAIAKAVGCSQQRISQIWKLLISLIESLNSKISKNPEHEEMVGVVENIATESPPDEATNNLIEVFFEWIQPDDQIPIFQKLSRSAQQGILSALMGSLPMDMLDAIETAIQWLAPESLTEIKACLEIKDKETGESDYETQKYVIESIPLEIRDEVLAAIGYRELLAA